jgi:antirepressor protein
MTALVKFAFHGDELDVVMANGVPQIGLRRACEALGVDFASQLVKLQDDPAATVGMIPMVGADRRTRDIVCIDLRSMPLWLATIHPSKVRPEVRPKLIAYKRECAEVLADHFLGRRSLAPNPAQGQPAPDGLFTFLERLVDSHQRLALRVEQLEDGRRKPKPAKPPPDLTDLKRRILLVVQSYPGCSKRKMRDRIRGRSTWIDRACTELLAEGQLRRRELTVQHHAYYAC